MQKKRLNWSSPTANPSQDKGLKNFGFLTDIKGMKTLIILTLFLSLNAMANSDESKKDEKKAQMDYGDKQLLKRDSCRKPIEYLETRYPDVKKEELEKMKANCTY